MLISSGYVVILYVDVELFGRHIFLYKNQATLYTAIFGFESLSKLEFGFAEKLYYIQVRNVHKHPLNPYTVVGLVKLEILQTEVVEVPNLRSVQPRFVKLNI